MAAITWRNVNGPSVADAARPLELARQGFNDTFRNLGDLLTQRQAAVSQAEELARNTARENYLDLVQGASTPEQLAALQQSGQLQQAYQALDPRVRAQVRGADDKRLGALRTDVMEGNKFADQTEDRTTRDARAAATAAILRGDPTAMDQINTLPARFQGDLLKAQDARGEELLGRNRAGIRFDREGVKFDREGRKLDADLAEAADKLKTNAAQRGLYAAQAENARFNSAAAKASAAATTAAAKADETERNRAAVRTALVGENSLYKDFTTPEKNIDALTKTIADRKLNSDQDDNLREAVSKKLYHTFKAADGSTMRIPVPLPILETALQTSSQGNGTWFQFDSTVAKNFEKRVDQLVKQHGAQIIDDYSALESLKAYNIQNPPSKRSEKK